VLNRSHVTTIWHLRPQLQPTQCNLSQSARNVGSTVVVVTWLQFSTEDRLCYWNSTSEYWANVTIFLFEQLLQSRPIKMRAPILYLANRWMDSKMLSSPNRFSYLVILLLLAFHWIPQFIAQFCSICPFVCPPLPLRLNCINLRDRARLLLPICAPDAIFLLSLLLRKQNGGAKRSYNH